MRKNLAPIALLLGTVLLTPKAKAQDQAEAQNSGPVVSIDACFTDNFGYKWKINLKVNGRKFHGTGKVDIGAVDKWNATIDGKAYGPVTFVGSNPLPDGCASGYVDYFQYDGTCVAGLFYGTNFYFDGSGSWASYCTGGVINSGSWVAHDCGHPPAPGVTSKQPARSGNTESSLKVVPNPIISSGKISYSVPTAGKVNITVYNSMQQAVKVLVNEVKTAGNYSAVWDAKGSNATSGVYRVVATVNGKIYSSSIQVVR